jgi:hypothetical protein
MNLDVVRSALADIEREVELARDAKQHIEDVITDRRTEGSSYEDPEAALTSFLTALFERLLVILEAAGLVDTRNRLIERWPNLDVEKTTYDGRFDYAENKAYEYLSTLVDALRSIVADARSPAESYEIAQLETVLARTAVLLRRRDCVPVSEVEIQRVMHDYLEALYSDYRRTVRIPGIIKDFQPDGGVRHLRAAIEFKFATTKEEVTRALGGIFEDVSGYAGSRDWTRFYTVVYQTEPFESEDRVRTELVRAGALTWKCILVTGAGARGAVSAKSVRPRLAASRKGRHK